MKLDLDSEVVGSVKVKHGVTKREVQSLNFMPRERVNKIRAGHQKFMRDIVHRIFHYHPFSMKRVYYPDMGGVMRYMDVMDYGSSQ